MSDFKIGQLVACRQAACAEWLLGIFDGEKDGRLYVRPPLSLTCASKKPEWFSQVEPAERIWPGLFLGGHRRDELVYRQALDKAHDQIRWLCRQIMYNALHRKQSDFCPPLDMPKDPDGRCQTSCEICWEQASLKAVEENNDESL